MVIPHAREACPVFSCRFSFAVLVLSKAVRLVLLIISRATAGIRGRADDFDGLLRR
jgi:hypothetical protein